MERVSSSVGNDPMIHGARRGGEYSMARYAPSAKEIELMAKILSSRRARYRERLCTTTMLLSVCATATINGTGNRIAHHTHLWNKEFENELSWDLDVGPKQQVAKLLSQPREHRSASEMVERSVGWAVTPPLS
jgi:hypothetical protein